MICTWVMELMLHGIVSVEMSVTTHNTTSQTNASSATTISSNTDFILKKSPSSDEKNRNAKEAVRLSKTNCFKDFLRKYKYVLRCFNILLYFVIVIIIIIIIIIIMIIIRYYYNYYHDDYHYYHHYYYFYYY